MDALTDLIFGSQRTIGRYFSIVSTIPSALLAVFGFALIKSGAWAGYPHWSRSASAISSIRFGDAAFLAIISLAISFALHPLQFPLVQLFEGYWGVSAPMQRVRRTRIAHYRDRAHAFKRARGQLNRVLEGAVREGTYSRDEHIAQISMRDELERRLQDFPREPSDIAPTRLGNVLRRYERMAGAVYHLDAVAITPPLLLISDPQHIQHVHDQRIQLDLTIRLCLISLISTLLSLVFLWHDGLWLLIALACYSIAYLFYRGTVAIASEFGVAFTTLIELNRFTLYERLHMPRPSNLSEECARNDILMDLLSGDRPKVEWEYDDSAASTYHRRQGISRWRGRERRSGGDG